MEIKTKTLTALTIACLLTACGTTPPPTVQEQAQMNELRQAMIQRFTQAAQNQPNQQQQQPVVQQKVITEQELMDAVAQVSATGSAALFEPNRDGVLINDAMYLDPEGGIVKVGSNAVTGHFTYVVKNFDGTFSLKFARAGSQAAPLLVATILQSGPNYTVRTVTGKTLTGTGVIPTADGVVVAREGSAFRYTIGEDVRAISVPNGYQIAATQKGDVSASGFILLEKIADNSDLGKLISGASSIGGMFGLSKSDDYVLASITTGSLIPLDVRLDGKEVAEYSNCRRQNSYVNKCDTMDMKESLYRPGTGLRNGNHYFWAIDWVNTEIGPVAFYKTSSKLYAIDINSQSTHLLFSRALGLNNFDIKQNANGKVFLTAQLGFSRENIEDVVEFIKSRASTEIVPMQLLSL